MHFYRLKDAPTSQFEALFRQSPWNKVAGLLVGLALTAGFVVVVVNAGGCVAYLGLAFACLFPLIMGSMLLRTLRPSNWLLKHGNRGLLINFRSYLNTRFSDEDIVVLELPSSEMIWAGKTIQRLITPGHEGGSKCERLTYLEIKVNSADLKELEQHLCNERTRPAAGKYYQSKACDYPVSLVEGDVLRLTWRSASSWITPGVDRALALLSPHVKIRPEERRLLDMVTDPKDLAQQEQQILALAESGDLMGATRLVRKRYGYSLTQAKQFVEGLLSQSQVAETNHASRRDAAKSGQV